MFGTSTRALHIRYACKHGLCGSLLLRACQEQIYKYYCTPEERGVV